MVDRCEPRNPFLYHDLSQAFSRLVRIKKFTSEKFKWNGREVLLDKTKAVARETTSIKIPSQFENIFTNLLKSWNNSSFWFDFWLFDSFLVQKNINFINVKFSVSSLNQLLSQEILLVFTLTDYTLNTARSFTWYKTAMLEFMAQKNKEVVSFIVFIPFDCLVHCICYSPLWQFCTTWMTNYLTKGLIPFPPFFPTPSLLFYSRHFSRYRWLSFLSLCSETARKRLLRRLQSKGYLK